MSQGNPEQEQQGQEAEARSGRNWGRIAMIAVLIVVVGGVAYYFYRRSQHRYDAFARCLSSRGVKMYGAWWCPHCQEQKDEFGASFKYAPYVECGVKGDMRAANPVCKDADIKHFPTWQFPPVGERVEGVISLEELSDRTGCPLP